MIETEIKRQFKSWAAFCRETGQDRKNFKWKLNRNIVKINKWIEPLGLEIQIIKKVS
jgi:hypothetical protein